MWDHTGIVKPLFPLLYHLIIVFKLDILCNHTFFNHSHQRCEALSLGKLEDKLPALLSALSKYDHAINYQQKGHLWFQYIVISLYYVVN